MGHTQAIRVVFEDLAAPWNLWNNVEMRVGPPREACENSGEGLETLPESCPDPLPTRTFWTATLGYEPHWRDDWTVDGRTIHVRHEGIIPLGSYSIQVIDSTCPIDCEGQYSDALMISMPLWGDMCGPGFSGACSEGPDGVADVTNDVLGCLDKFSNINAMLKASADIEGAVVDLKVNVANDVLYALAGFTGTPYPFAPSGATPCAAE